MPTVKAKSIAICLMLCAGAASPVIAQSTDRSGRIAAANASGCANAARAFGEQRHAENLRSFEEAGYTGRLLQQRVQQSRQTWLVARYERNLNRCIRWFESGRSGPFYPS